MTQYLTAGETLNQAAVEVGLAPANNPYSAADVAFKQLEILLNTAGKRLVYHYAWERLVREHLFQIDGRTPADYPLPADFAYMIDQTGWLRDQNVPLAGPLSSQDWQYLLGRNLLSSTIYASFRLNLGMLRIFAQGQLLQENIAYEYMSENWVQPNGVTDQNLFVNKASVPSDVILFPDPLPTLYLKARFLSAKGFDSTEANAEFSDAFLAWSGLNKSAAKLNMARNYLGYPYLDAWRNLPDTGYGNKPVMG